MNAVGKIGVIMPEITDPLEHELLQGISSVAQKYGYDVIIFTGAFNSHVELQYDGYIYGLENIYELICKAEVDGIIYASASFHNNIVRERIYDFLKQIDTPTLLLGEEHDEIPYIFSPQRESIKMVTKHLVEEHNCRKIYCVTGFENHYESDERLAGYTEALNEAGLYTDKSCVFYGSFWTDVPYKLGCDICEGKVDKPDAIVCASDVMAMALIDALTENGMRVPEDIAVTGYDGSWVAYSNTPQITTVCGRDFQLGSEAVYKLFSIMEKNAEYKNQQYQYISYGTSCGCKYANSTFDNSNLKKHFRDYMMKSVNRKAFTVSNCNYFMSQANTLEELMDNIDKLGHVLMNWKWLDICLCEDWKFDFGNPEKYRQHGFSDNIILALSKRTPKNEKSGYMFNVKEILPELSKPHEPVTVLITSLHCEEQIFGYIATAYEKTVDLSVDEYYINWCDAVSNGLYHLQRRLYSEYTRQQIEELSVHDPATGLYNKRGFLEQLPVFVKKYRKHNAGFSLVVLSGVRNSNTSVQAGIDESLIIANGLRLSADSNEIYGRIGDNIFAVFVSLQSAEKDIAEKRVSRLEEKIKYIQGDVSSLRIPDFIFETSTFENQSINEMYAVLDQKINAVMEKSNAMACSLINYKEQLNQLRREIYLYPQKDWNIPSILTKLNISRSHFQRIYKTQFSVNCIDDIINARLEKAEQLLLHTGMRVNEIAVECGYSNENHFMRQFKNKYGVTASQYRKKL